MFLPPFLTLFGPPSLFLQCRRLRQVRVRDVSACHNICHLLLLTAESWFLRRCEESFLMFSAIGGSTSLSWGWGVALSCLLPDDELNTEVHSSPLLLPLHCHVSKGKDTSGYWRPGVGSALESCLVAVAFQTWMVLPSVSFQSIN